MVRDVFRQPRKARLQESLPRPTSSRTGLCRVYAETGAFPACLSLFVRDEPDRYAEQEGSAVR